MIDIHSHLLPGVDDGPRTMDESVEMARRAVEGGTTTMVCTPHMHPRMLTPPERVHEGVAALRRELTRAEVPLEIQPGGEISVEQLRVMDDAALGRSTIGLDGRWLLVEMPFTGWPLDLSRLLDDLEIRGFRAVLAHPERSESVQRQPDRLRDAIGRGAITQITAASLVGEHGPAAGRAARQLLRLGWAHVMASDSHSASWRGPDMRAGLRVAVAELGGDAETVRWMVEEGPALVVAGKDVRPPRPAARRRPTPARAT